MRLAHVACVHDDGQHDDAGHAPDDADGSEGVARRPVAHRHDGVAHGEEAVPAHRRERVGAREHVDARQHVVDLAHRVAERPMSEQDSGHHQRKSEEERAVGDRQVEDVHVRDRLHLAVARHDEDDQPVANDPHCADDTEYDDHDDGH